ncbi:hypothetical protein SAMN05216516_101215 [Izhakiella capsodis]|uniref:Uncharacterized protein n=1 Tax=Izhakiella capsodis TaxID=1367852 RepID=A0A1I4UMS1_9GAMM|nr:hypothetical protein SAMN05216516_101215 [Izhakiella capsodis]
MQLSLSQKEVTEAVNARPILAASIYHVVK